MNETRLEIFWSQKLLGTVPHARIATVGGILPAGRWEMLECEAIHALALRRHTFFVMVNGVEVEVTVGRHDDRWYLKGAVDGYSPKTLLDLPDGPPEARTPVMAGGRTAEVGKK
jgi:hypothetical protein